MRIHIVAFCHSVKLLGGGGGGHLEKEGQRSNQTLLLPERISGRVTDSSILYLPVDEHHSCVL